MKIYVDFDKTLTKTHLTDLNTAPNQELIDLLITLNLYGHEIIIFSCRSNIQICDKEDEHLMILWLRKHQVPYSRIEKNKPYYDLLIDDRSINPLTSLENLKNLCEIHRDSS